MLHSGGLIRRLEFPLHGRLVSILTAIACLVLAFPAPGHAQFAGSNVKGDFGLKSGTQPPPGWYASGLYYHYGGDTLRGRNGDSIAIDPDERGQLGVNAYAVGLLGVTDFKILGANYGFLVIPAFADNKLAAPIVEFERSSGTGVADLYLQPLNLGWHTDRADFTGGFGLFAPTGRYDVDADDNLSLGMWSFEWFGGTTVFFDEAKSWHAATTAYYETHTQKRDTDITVGDLLTLEGGFGKSYLEGALSVGAAYYVQWKVTADDPGAALRPIFNQLQIGKHRVFGLGPEVTIPIASRDTFFGAVTARYYWESGARTTLEGSTFVLTAAVPIPSVPIR